MSLLSLDFPRRCMIRHAQIKYAFANGDRIGWMLEFAFVNVIFWSNVNEATHSHIMILKVFSPKTE